MSEEWLTADDLDWMQEGQSATMRDTAVLLSYAAGATGSYGKKADNYPDGDSVSCGYDARPVMETQGDAQVVIADATLRLPFGTEVDKRDRVRITHQHGVALSPAPVYEFVGAPKPGPTALVAQLKRYTGG